LRPLETPSASEHESMISEEEQSDVSMMGSTMLMKRP